MSLFCTVFGTHMNFDCFSMESESNIFILELRNATALGNRCVGTSLPQEAVAGPLQAPAAVCRFRIKANRIAH